jgi:hypothetical protein
MDPGASSHYQARADIRAAAMLLQSNAGDAAALVINGFPSVVFYFGAVDYAFIERTHQRH